MGEGLPTFTQFFNLMRSSSGDGDPMSVLLTLEFVTWNVCAEALCSRRLSNKRPAFPGQGPAPLQPWRCRVGQSLPGPRLPPRGSGGHTRMCWHSPQAPACERGSSPSLRPPGRRPGCRQAERLSHRTERGAREHRGQKKPRVLASGTWTRPELPLVPGSAACAVLSFYNYFLTH